MHGLETVQLGRYRECDATNRFYKSLGFREFEVFPTLWDAWSPCQAYVMALRGEDAALKKPRDEMGRLLKNDAPRAFGAFG